MLKKILIIILMIPCIAFGQSKLAKYQKKILGSENVSQNSAEKWVSVTLQNNPPASIYSPSVAVVTKRNVFNLSDKGQKAFINSLSSKAKDEKSFVSSVPTSLEPSDASGGSSSSLESKKTDFLKKFEIDVTDLSPKQNSGRIAQLIIWLTLDDTKNVEFSGFNNLTTKYQVIDFGTLSESRTSGFTFNAGLNIGGTGSTSTSVANANGGTTTTTTGETATGTTNGITTAATGGNTTGNTTGVTTTNTGGTTNSSASNLGATYTNSKTIAEQIAIKNSIISMKGSVSSNEVSLLQNGAPNQNLDDNIDMQLILKVVNTYSVPYLKFKGLIDKEANTAVKDESKLAISKGYFTLPQINTDVKGTISYTYVYREVVKGENTAMESDDKVFFHNMKKRDFVSKPITILKAKELNVKLYHIVTKNGTLYLSYYGKKIELRFDDMNSPNDFIQWLIETKRTKIKGCDILVNTDSGFIPYKSDMIEELEFQITNL